MNDAGNWIWLKACNSLGVPVLNEDLCMPEASAAIQAFLSGGGSVQNTLYYTTVYYFAECSCFVACKRLANKLAFRAAMTQ